MTVKRTKKNHETVGLRFRIQVLDGNVGEIWVDVDIHREVGSRPRPSLMLRGVNGGITVDTSNGTKGVEIYCDYSVQIAPKHYGERGSCVLCRYCTTRLVVTSRFPTTPDFGFLVCLGIPYVNLFRCGNLD